MGRVNKPILIFNIIVCVAALVLMYFAVRGQSYYIFYWIPLGFVLGLVLLVFPIACIITTFIGKSKFAFYLKDETILSEQDELFIYRKDKPLTEEEITELEKIEMDVDE